jgi:Family of unknown function (DUF6166)
MRISGEPGSRVVWIDDRPLSPFRSQRVWNHSPDGFNWGYDGSGPAQLALAILLAAGLKQARAVALHQQFKREILAPLPQGRRFALEIDVAAWAQRAEAHLARTFAIEVVGGVEAIRCLLCNRISELPGDVANRYCGRCHLFHEAVAEGRQLVEAGGAHECQEWPTARDVCALCGAPITR